MAFLHELGDTKYSFSVLLAHPLEKDNVQTVRRIFSCFFPYRVRDFHYVAGLVPMRRHFVAV